MNPVTRRSFLRVSAGAGALAWTGSFSRFGLLNAVTPASTDYRALVCVFLFGGNDSNNMIVPMDGTSFTDYTNLRKTLALPTSSLMQVQAANNSVYAFHSSLPDVAQLFQSGKVAVVANVGTLVQPLTRTQYVANNTLAPNNLFSHSDQQSQWQTTVSHGSSSTGWSGRLADVMSALNPSNGLPTFVSVAGNSLQGTGNQTSPITVTPGAPLGLQGFDTTAASQARLTSLQELLTLDTGVTLIQQASTNMSRGITNDAIMSRALSGAPALTTTFPANNSIASQLEQVAKLIQVRAALGMNRQIFFCSLGGFDTHTDQLNTQKGLFAQLSPALRSFYAATQELGVENQVTTFTESDFSRTFQPNTNGGTDHGWGSHHLVLGGAVQGGRVVGNFPVFALNGVNDAGNGRWIPQFSVDQYGATLAAWFGALPNQLNNVFPNFAAFNGVTLGFMG